MADTAAKANAPMRQVPAPMVTKKFSAPKKDVPKTGTLASAVSPTSAPTATKVGS